MPDASKKKISHGRITITCLSFITTEKGSAMDITRLVLLNRIVSNHLAERKV